MLLKRDIVDQLHRVNSQHLKKDIGDVVDLVFETLAGTLAEGGRVEIRGFGSFAVHGQKGRRFVNPKTGKAVDLPDGHRVVFKPGKDLKDLS